MLQTSLSLLQRLTLNTDSRAWDELVSLYSPLLRSWLSRYAIQPCDAEDLTQEILLAVVADVGKFQHPGHSGAFRGWLRAILVNRLRSFWRKRRSVPIAPTSSDFWQRLDELEDPQGALALMWNDEHDRFVVGRLLERVAPRFSPNTFQIFRRYVLECATAEQVAAEWGVTVNAVFITKSRVLRALRQEIVQVLGQEEAMEFGV